MLKLKEIWIIIYFSIFFSTKIVKAHQYKFTKIAIDAGHGGKDPGTISKCKKFKEKDFSLFYAKKLKKEILKKISGVSVIMIRENDTFVDLFDRAKIANDNKVDLFITIHINSCPNPRAKGCEVYVMGPKAYWKRVKRIANLKEANIKTMERNTAAMENHVIFYERNYKKKYLKNISAPHSRILTNICSEATRKNSTVFANCLRDNLTVNTNFHPVKVREDGFILLWRVIAPSVYIELGFLSNIDDLKKLNNPKCQDDVINAIVKAILDYKTYIESSI